MDVIPTVLVDKAPKEHPNTYTNKNMTHTTVTDALSKHKDKSASEIYSQRGLLAR